MNSISVQVYIPSLRGPVAGVRRLLQQAESREVPVFCCLPGNMNVPDHIAHLLFRTSKREFILGPM